MIDGRAENRLDSLQVVAEGTFPNPSVEVDVLNERLEMPDALVVANLLEHTERIHEREAIKVLLHLCGAVCGHDNEENFGRPLVEELEVRPGLLSLVLAEI